MIAYVGPDLPHDLLAATARDAGPLGWAIDREMPAAARWLESKFPLWACSIVQDWADGKLDGLDAVLFSRADDSAQRLYYYLCELQRQGQVRGPEPLILDVSKIARPSSEAHLARAVRALAGRLSVDDAMLETAIAATNTRRASAPPVPPVTDRPVCLLAGSAPPDDRLHVIADSAGWAAMGATLQESWRDPGPRVQEGSGDPFAAVARQLHGRTQGSRAFFNRGEAIVADATRCGARAVLLWFAEEEEARVWHLPEQRRALEQAGIPVLALTRRDWRAADGIAAELPAFLRGLAA